MKTLFGHPRGLAVLFGTEMWERLSFYGMRALLAAYLAKYLLLPGHVEGVLLEPQVKSTFEFILGALTVQQFASWIYSVYLALIYASPLLGGWLADRWWGQRFTAMTGMVLMAFGHFMMASEALLFPALALLILGGGLFKTNTSAQVGLLYDRNDPRRDGGFTIFYVGINLGAFLAPFICGTLGEEAGWHYGFAAAGVGLLCALGVYLAGWKYLPPDVRPVREVSGKTPLTPQERRTVFVLLLLVLPLTLYWACNEQQGNTIAFWSIDHTNRGISFFGWHGEIPWTWFQSFNPFVIFVGAPLLAAWWRRQGSRQPSPTNKMITGCLLMTAANLLMAWSAWQGGVASWLWLAAYFVIMTIGEVMVYPVGLSLYSRVAPARFTGLIVGIYFLPNFLGGGFLQGWLASFWERMDKALFFVMIAGVAALAALIIWLLERPLRPLLKEAA